MPELHPQLLESRDNLSNARSSQKTMNFLDAIIKIKRKEKIENRICFFDYKAI